MKYGNCLATGIGSVPLVDVHRACDFVIENFPYIPFWPQLPKRSFSENMYAQYSEGLPGLQLGEERIHIDSKQALSELESFYERYLSEDLSSFAICSDYAAAFRPFINLAARTSSVKALKGHVTGPISFGLQVTDENKRSIIYDDNLRDVVTKQITRKAQWQEQEFKKLSKETIIFIDEPYLSSFGSAFVNLEREQVISTLDEVFDAIQGKSAVHCCGNTDWSLLLNTQVDILNFDAFEFAEALLLYKDDLKKFMQRGGILAWGIVPTESSKIESVTKLADKFNSSVTQLADDLGISQQNLLQQSLITPACGVGSGGLDNAIKVFNTAAQLSELVRTKHGLST